MLNIRMDHIVHFIDRNPMEAVKKVTDLGFTTVFGGQHKEWGTANSLFDVGNSYVEFLAVENRTVARSSNNPLINQLVKQNAEGPFQLCFRTKDIEKLKAAVQASGLKVNGIYTGSREAKNGEVLRWKMLFIDSEGTVPFPFFIEWEKPVRSANLIDEEMGRQRDRDIQSVWFAVRDAEKTALSWGRLFGVPLSYSFEIPESGAATAAVEAGGCELVFASPISRQSSLQENLDSRGEGPISISFDPPLENGGFSLFGGKYK